MPIYRASLFQIQKDLIFFFIFVQESPTQLDATIVTKAATAPWKASPFP